MERQATKRAKIALATRYYDVLQKQTEILRDDRYSTQPSQTDNFFFSKNFRPTTKHNPLPMALNSFPVLWVLLQIRKRGKI